MEALILLHYNMLSAYDCGRSKNTEKGFHAKVRIISQEKNLDKSLM